MPRATTHTVKARSLDMSDTKTLTVKVPTALHGRIVKMAEQEMRSLHAEILWLLRDAVERHEPKP